MGKRKFSFSALLHPLLFSIFPILFILAHNINELHISVIYIPLCISILFYALLFALLFLITKDSFKAGLGTTFFSLIFFNCGKLFEILDGLFIKIGLEKLNYPITIIFLLSLWIISFRILFRMKFSIKRLTTLFNISAVCLVFINIFLISYSKISNYLAYKTQDSHFEKESIKMKEQQNDQALPDIYYIILDECSGLNTIKNALKYNSENFKSDLYNTGFYIASESKTRHSSTHASMAESLNMKFLNNKEKENPYPLITNNRVVYNLKKSGYKIIMFPSPTQKPFRFTDQFHSIHQTYGYFIFDDFNVALIKSTMLKFLLEKIHTKKKWIQFHRNKTLYIFEKLAVVAKEKGPKFIYAHLLCPHGPYVFGKNGEEVGIIDHSDKNAYLNQYIFVTKKILEVVKKILKSSKSPPVIIIQSDHGLRSLPDNQWQDILNLYYFPGKNYNQLYNSISPVNTFRVIFNTYFGTNYPLIP